MEVNADNKDGTGGKLASEYSSLLKCLWLDNKPSTTPYQFKTVLGKINPEYSTFQQHDAHEVINFLLDKLHEDLNRVKKKEWYEELEGDGTNDAVIGLEAWTKHSTRHNSIIKDTIGSQCRSQLVCPDCGKVAVKYDYQHTIELAIPIGDTKTVNILYIPSKDNVQRVPILLNVAINRLNKISSIYDAVKTTLRLSADETPRYIFETSNEHRSITRILQDDESMLHIKDGSTFIGFDNSDQSKFPGKFFVYHRIIKDGRYTPGGFPHLISFDPTWSCARIRTAVWEVIYKYIKKDTKLGKIIKEAERQGPKKALVALMKYSEFFPLRLTDVHGKPVTPTHMSTSFTTSTLPGIEDFSAAGGIVIVYYYTYYHYHHYHYHYHYHYH